MAPASALTVGATAAAAQSDGAPETGLAAVHNLANNGANNNAPSVTSSLTPNSNPIAQSPGAITATTTDLADNAKPGLFSQSAQSTTTATLPTTADDKKSAAAVPPNVTLAPAGPASSTSVSATLSSATSSPGVPVALAAGKDSSAALTAPAPPAPAPPSPAGIVSAPDLPQTHQMLDSAPPAPPAPPPTPIAPGSAADVQMNAQMNAQMHVGIRTDAFGAVEIHTVVQQSQIGITVHADRDIARWFSSEVPGLESGLNKSHLNLTAVDFNNGRSGVQTATSFQHGQPRHSFSQTPSSPSAALPDAASPEQDTASQPATIDILPSDLSVGSAQSHVSIHA
jgi:hypothetical protein